MSEDEFKEFLEEKRSAQKEKERSISKKVQSIELLVENLQSECNRESALNKKYRDLIEEDLEGLESKYNELSGKLDDIESNLESALTFFEAINDYKNKKQTEQARQILQEKSSNFLSEFLGQRGEQQTLTEDGDAATVMFPGDGNDDGSGLVN